MAKKLFDKIMNCICLIVSALGYITAAICGYFYYLSEFEYCGEFGDIIVYGFFWLAFVATSILLTTSFLFCLIHLIRVRINKTELKKQIVCCIIISSLFVVPAGIKALPPLLRVQTSPENDYVAISAGNFFALALKSDGSIVGWGETGDIPDGNDFVAISAGDGHSVALKSDGSIVCWSNGHYADYGQFDAPHGNDYIKIAAGSCNSLALREDGSIMRWGKSGNITDENIYDAIAEGNAHSLALKPDGSLVAWANESYVYQQVVEIPKGNDFIDISAGDNCSLALKADGTIVCWGDWRAEDLVNNAPQGNGFIGISAGQWHCLALKSDGSIIAWGDNSDGESYAPKGHNYIAIDTGFGYSLALTADGYIIVWGDPLFSFKD